MLKILIHPSHKTKGSIFKMYGSTYIEISLKNLYSTDL